jgi:hypothetical protein
MAGGLIEDASARRVAAGANVLCGQEAMSRQFGRRPTA